MYTVKKTMLVARTPSETSHPWIYRIQTCRAQVGWNIVLYCIVFIYYQIIQGLQGLQGLTMNNDIDHEHLINFGANK